MPPADLQTLLIAVARIRAGQVTAADVMRRWEADRFVQPAAWAEALTEYPGQHFPAVGYVRDLPRIPESDRKAISYETRDHLEAGPIAVKTVPGHRAG